MFRYRKWKKGMLNDVETFLNDREVMTENEFRNMRSETKRLIAENEKLCEEIDEDNNKKGIFGFLRK